LEIRSIFYRAGTARRGLPEITGWRSEISYDDWRPSDQKVYIPVHSNACFNLNKNGAVSDGVLHVRLLRRERRCWERSQQVVFAEKKRV
jgi:hypothetical protein